MTTMIVISSAAVLVALLGSVLIWGWDALRADEIEHATVPPANEPPALRANTWERP